MVKIKIVNGVYGYKPNGGHSVRTARYGEVVDVSKTEAKRLQGLGVAVPWEDTKATTPPAADDPPQDTDKNGDEPGAPAAADPVV